jgi:hypothetical protein
MNHSTGYIAADIKTCVFVPMFHELPLGFTYSLLSLQDLPSTAFEAEHRSAKGEIESHPRPACRYILYSPAHQSGSDSFISGLVSPCSTDLSSPSLTGWTPKTGGVSGDGVSWVRPMQANQLTRPDGCVQTTKNRLVASPVTVPMREHGPGTPPSGSLAVDRYDNTASI